MKWMHNWCGGKTFFFHKVDRTEERRRTQWSGGSEPWDWWYWRTRLFIFITPWHVSHPLSMCFNVLVNVSENSIQKQLACFLTPLISFHLTSTREGGLSWSTHTHSHSHTHTHTHSERERDTVCAHLHKSHPKLSTLSTAVPKNKRVRLVLFSIRNLP